MHGADKKTNERSARRRAVVSFLRVCPSGPAVLRDGRLEPIFLRQSDLDGACGAHCALMALIAMGYLKRSEVTSLGTKLPTPQAKRAWSWIQRDYFVGVDTSQLCSLIHVFNTGVRCSLTDAKGLRASRWINAHQREGRFVVIGVDSPGRAFDHWTLGIGYEVRGSRRRLLLLDPASDSKPYRSWNAVFEEPANEGRGTFTDSSGSRYFARLSGAVALIQAGEANHG